MICKLLTASRTLILFWTTGRQNQFACLILDPQIAVQEAGYSREQMLQNRVY